MKAKKSKSFLFNKNLVFGIILFIGVNFLFLLYQSFERFFPNFVSQLLILSRYDNAFDALVSLCSSTDFWLSMLVGILITYFAIKGTFLLIVTTTQLIKTSSYVKSFEKIKKENYIEILSEGYEAFTYGIIRPKIYISKRIIDEFTQEEIEAILSHEKAHVKGYDPIKYLITRFITDFLPRIPFKKEVFTNFEVLCELSADEYAESFSKSKRYIVSSLLKIKQGENGLNLNGIAGFSIKRNRINVLTGNESFKTKSLISVLSFLGFLVLALNILVYVRCQSIVQCQIEDGGQITSDKIQNSAGVDNKTYCIQSINNQSIKYCNMPNSSSLDVKYSSKESIAQ